MVGWESRSLFPNSCARHSQATLRQVSVAAQVASCASTCSRKLLLRQAVPPVSACKALILDAGLSVSSFFAP